MGSDAKENSDVKVNLAIQTYELVDKHIRRLDADLARFETEMKEAGGRLSQTESEGETEGKDTDQGQRKKKKQKTSGEGRKGESEQAVRKVGAADVGQAGVGVGGQ